MRSTLTQPLARPRLVSALLAARLGLIEAGGGYGKSVLLGQVRDALAIGSLEVTLGPRDGTPTGLVGRLRVGAARSNLSDLVGALGPVGTVTPSLDGLATAISTWTEPFLLIVDDAHLLDPDAAALLADAIEAWPAPHRCLVAARVLPGPLARLRTAPDVVKITADDLRLDRAETVALVATRFGIAVDAVTAARLQRVTDGWAAAVTLLGTRAVHTGGDDALAHLLDRGPTFTSLLSEAIGRLDPVAVTVLGHLARLVSVPASAPAALGQPDLAMQAAAAGIPMTTLEDGSWVLPGPVQEALIDAAPLDVTVGARLGRYLVGLGEELDGLRLLVESGAPEVAASVLAGLSPERVLLVDHLGIQSFVDSLPHSVVERHPGVLLQLARSCEPPGRFAVRTEVLARAERIAVDAGDGPMSRAIWAERSRDLVRDGRREEAAALAEHVTSEAGPGETLARARALDVHGRCLAWRRDEGSLRRAGEVMASALALCIAQRQRQWASQVAMPLAVEAQHGIGLSDEALRTLDEAMRWLPARSIQRALILTFRAQIQNDVGRPDAADADIAEALHVAEVLRNSRVVAYASWELARTEALRGRRAEALVALRTVERHAGDWFEHGSGATFLAVAAEVAVLVGESALAFAYLERATARREESAAPVDLAIAAVHARIGDPARALAAVERLATSDRRWPRDAWRCELFRALALERQGGDPRPAARAALDGAARLGIPDLPVLREGEAARRMIALLGSPAAVPADGQDGARPPDLARGSVEATLAGGTGTLVVLALGGLELRRDGRPLDPPVGRPYDVLGMLVAAGGRADADAIADQLWPEEDDADLRTRLRNVLSRAREALGPVIERRGQQVVLVGVEVDAWAFEAEARSVAARFSGDPERSRLARSAIGRYRGDLFADQRDAAWAVAPRERLRRMTRACVAVLVEEAEARSDVDEALRLLDRVLELDVDDEATYLRAARLLVSQGREAAARAMLDRGRRTLGELGVPVPPAFVELEARLRRPGRS